MKTYKANYKYYVAFAFGLFFIFIAVLLFWILKNSGYNIASWAMMVPVVIIIYLLFFVTPIEISIGKTGIIYKTIFLSIRIDYSQIRYVKVFYSTKSLQWAAGNKDKAEMLCVIAIKGKLILNYLLLGNGINNYKELHTELLGYMDE